MTHDEKKPGVYVCLGGDAAYLAITPADFSKRLAEWRSPAYGVTTMRFEAQNNDGFVEINLDKLTSWSQQGTWR